jgi:hypothetical protein
MENNVNENESFPSLGIVGGQEVNNASVSASIAAGFDQLAKELAKINETLNNGNIKVNTEVVEQPVIENPVEETIEPTPVEAPAQVEAESNEDEKAIFEAELNRVVEELNKEKSANLETKNLENTEDFSNEISNILKEIKPEDANNITVAPVEPIAPVEEIKPEAPVQPAVTPVVEPEAKPFSEVNVSTIEQPEEQPEIIDMETLLSSANEPKVETPVPTVEPVVQTPVVEQVAPVEEIKPEAPVAEVKKAYSDVTPLYSGLAIPGTEVKTGDGKHRTYIASDNSKLQVKKSEEKTLVMSNAA